MSKVPLAAFLFALLWTASLGTSAREPSKADQVLLDAEAQAKEQHKTIFLVFGASWCAQCHNLDSLLAGDETHPIFDKYFVVAQLHLGEEAGKHPELNTPGAGKLLTKFGGISIAAEGVPFIVLLDQDGKRIVNSKRPVGKNAATANIGFPSEPDEITWFIIMIRKAAPAMTDVESRTIENSLQPASAS